MRQLEAVYGLLQDRPEGITAIDALNEAGCFRLAARISDLRDMGYRIESEMVTLKDGKRVARYTLVDPTLWAKP